MSDAVGFVETAAPAAAAGGHVQYLPVPAWVRHAPPPAVPAGAAEDFTDNGVLRILHDTQLSLLQAGVARHARVVQRILTRAGAEHAANLAFEFDPAHERLEIHSIRVVRGETYTEHARAGAMQLLRRESQLERLTLNGRLTASLVIPDLRQDDQLEISLTQVSAFPVLSGRFSGWLLFNAYAPWIETRVRLVHPPARPVALKPFNSPPVTATREVDGHVDLAWSMVRQKRLPIEDLMPTWTVKNPCYEASEFASWNEVAQIFAPHYEDTQLPDGVRVVRDQLAAAHADQAMLAVEWLRFVQTALRYFATSLADGGLLPRDLDTIWTRRYGDCKDAVRLYVAGARSLGLDACAALVSTTHGMSLGDFIPSVQIFNHAIVRLRIGGNTYWLDPTMSSQGGSLQELVMPHAGWALPLTLDAAALEALPSAEPVRIVHCEDRISVAAKVDSPARLARRMEFSYWIADDIRHAIANHGASKIAAQLLKELRTTYPRAVETQKPSFEEVASTNQLIMRCEYELEQPWSAPDERKLRALPLLDTVTNKQLAALGVARRHSPIHLGRPRRVTWRATVDMPRRWGGKGWCQVLDERGLKFTSNLDISRRTVVIDRELVVSAWSTDADQADGYIRVVTQANRNVTRLLARTRFGRIAPTSGPLRWFFANRRRRVFLILAIVILYEILLNTLTRR
jgi:transglutaminase-like putative cysteine protease